MGVQVSTGAEVMCSFGTSPAVFNASSVDVDATTPAGVITDVEIANIPTFGTCNSPLNPALLGGVPPPCLPVLTPWTPGSASVTIGGVPALDDTSECSCAWTGVVTVTSPGQEAVTVE